MGFIYTVCKKWKNLPNREDILQTACYATLKALSRVKEDAEEKAIRTYVAKYIDGYVMKMLKKSCVVSIPEREVKEVELRIESFDFENDGLTFEFLKPYIEIGYENVEIMADLDLMTRKMSDKKRKTAYLLMQGYERKDIAKVMGCSIELIRLRTKDICKCLNKKVLTK